VPGACARLRRPVSAAAVHRRDNNFNIVCKRDPISKGEDKYYEFSTIQIATNLGVPYSLAINEETIYGPARQSNAASQIGALAYRSADLERSVTALRGELEKVRVTTHFFYVHSGESGLVRPVGDIRSWYDVIGKSEKDVNAQARAWYCPNAHRVEARILYSESGGGHGKHQWTVNCIFLNPKADQLSAAAVSGG
jgi:hypothetical protein